MSNIIEKFLRGDEMPTPELRRMQKTYQKELNGATKSGCTKCKKNRILRKWRQQVRTKM